MNRLDTPFILNLFFFIIGSPHWQLKNYTKETIEEHFFIFFFKANRAVVSIHSALVPQTNLPRPTPRATLTNLSP